MFSAVLGSGLIFTDLGWWIFHALWQGTAIAVALFVALSTIPAHDARRAAIVRGGGPLATRATEPARPMILVPLLGILLCVLLIRVGAAQQAAAGMPRGAFHATATFTASPPAPNR